MKVLNLTESWATMIKDKKKFIVMRSWHFYNELEVMNLMNQIDYGWMDKNFKFHREVNNLFSNNYILQEPREVVQNKVGICWDQVELERHYFKNNDWNIKTYFIVYYDNDKCPTHTFLSFQKNDNYFWFEHAWEKFRGIHQYSSLKELLTDIKSKFIENELNNNYDQTNLVIFEYQKPKYHISVQQFYRHCEFGKRIDLNNL